MIRRTAVALVALAACLGVAACGGSEDGSSGDALARSELVERADAICKEGETAAAAVEAPEDLTDANDAAAYFEQIVPLHRKQTDDLAALEPDDAARADWDAFMAAQNANQRLLETILAKAKASDRSGQQDLAQFTAKSQEFARAATKVGSKECAGTA